MQGSHPPNLGDVRPSERSFKRNSQYAKALDEVVKAGDALTDCEIFIYAFRLAAKIMIDVLTDGKMKEL